MTHHDLAQLAAQAYTDPPDFVAGSMHGIVRDIDGARVIAIAGTDDAEDWIAHNLRAGFRRWRLGLRCHDGFADAADLLSRSEGFRHHLANAWNTVPRVVFTGHSLGGAIAQLLAIQYAADECVTFGAPRVFDAESAAVAGTLPGGHNLTRYCHRNDPVSMVPPYHWGYRHVGRPWWWDGRRWRRRMGPLATAGTMLAGLLRFRGLVSGAIADHGMEHYMRITEMTPGRIVVITEGSR